MSDNASGPQFRLTPADLFSITGRRRVQHQAAWFKEYLGVEVPCDAKGPVLTKASYEALVAKRVGLLDSKLTGVNEVIVHPRTPKQRVRREA